MQSGRAYRKTVRLLGIPEFYQGSHDAMCTYYAGAMLLAGLRPEMEDSLDFENPRVDDNPIIANSPRHGSQTIEGLFINWIKHGSGLDSLCKSLNRVCENSQTDGIETCFEHFRRKRIPRTYADIVKLIDDGLPCIIGWDSDELGSHAVVVTGYDYYRHSRWLLLNDPSDANAKLEWDQLRALTHGKLDLIACINHNGVRPDRLTTKRSRNQAIVSRQLERWWLTTDDRRQYVDLYPLIVAPCKAVAPHHHP
jgi:hypothetical protein